MNFYSPKLTSTILLLLLILSNADPSRADSIDPLLLTFNDTEANFTISTDSTDQIVLTFDPGFEVSNTTVSQLLPEDLQFMRKLSGQYPRAVIKLPRHTDLSDLRPLLSQLENIPGIFGALPDRVVVPFADPPVSDTYLNYQWALFKDTAAIDGESYSFVGMDVLGAWEVTKGSEQVTVAVLDSGHVDHPDLEIAGGYDFIQAWELSGDDALPVRDSRDEVPLEEGTSSTSYCIAYSEDNDVEISNSWHGTHVLGTVGATVDNRRGVAGVDWNAKLLSVRVLTSCGGSTSDVVDGIRWAAGLEVTDRNSRVQIPVNPNPARVINLSLGCTADIEGLRSDQARDDEVADRCSCTDLEQEAINDAVSVGAIVVAAAGNMGTTLTAPANCANVISVGATNMAGDRAAYSCRGGVTGDVTAWAPGGDTREDRISILSTVDRGSTDREGPAYGIKQGTSMAAPHVSGVVSLMLSVNPSLTSSQVAAILRETSTPFAEGSECERQQFCGTGIVNAAAAVRRAASSDIPPDTGLDPARAPGGSGGRGSAEGERGASRSSPVVLFSPELFAVVLGVLALGL